MSVNMMAASLRCSVLPPGTRALNHKLFVSDRRAGRAGEVDDFKAFKSGFPTPLAKIRARIIKSLAKFDQHVQRHEQTEHVLAPGVVNERLDGDQRATGRQGVVGAADEVHL